MAKIRNLLLCLCLCYTAGAFAEVLKLKTDPVNADVHIRDLGNTQSLKIGSTPFEANMAELSANYAKSNFFILVVEKEGYVSQSILLSDLLKSDIELSINLLPKEDIIHYRKIDKNINDILESIRLSRLSQYDSALELLKKVEDEQPQLSIVPELMGNLYYLKQDQKASLAAYEKAYKLNPENKDSYILKGYLRKSLGGNK